MKLKLVLAYDGQPYDGWQSQAGGNAVQDHLEAAVARICGGRVAVHGSGRTDAGVHAEGQVAHFSPPETSRMQPADWQRALNAGLPPRIRVMGCGFVPEAFHARFSALGKRYRYVICNRPVLPPAEVGRAWHLPMPLDFDRLQAAAQRCLGTHDFRSFAANRGRPEKDTVRRITLARWKAGRDLTFEVEGDGFLYKMVRLLVGASVRVAQGKAEIGWIEDLLAHPALGRNSHVAPAGGLCLVRVRYPSPASLRPPGSRKDRE
ncbi:MAG TPA: tRNA pseudouridine(38-40) synthase TruA [Chthoniobacterales bacterium]